MSDSSGKNDPTVVLDLANAGPFLHPFFVFRLLFCN